MRVLMYQQMYFHRLGQVWEQKTVHIEDATAIEIAVGFFSTAF